MPSPSRLPPTLLLPLRLLAARPKAALSHALPVLQTSPRAAAVLFSTGSGSGSGSTPVLRQKQMPPRPPPPPEEEIAESFLKGSGPGGQKINKTNSAVQLTHLPTGIVVKSQATRSRSQNRKIARELLAARLDELRNGGQSRTAVVGEHKRKKKASASKKSRRKYRKLGEDEEKQEEDEGEEEVDENKVETVGTQTSGESRADKLSKVEESKL